MANEIISLINCPAEQVMLRDEIEADYLRADQTIPQATVGTFTFPNLIVSGSLSTGYIEKSDSYTITQNDHTINCTTGTFNITLPTAVGISGRIYNIKNTGTGVITVICDGSETIDGETTQTITQWENLKIQSTATGWIII